MARWLPLDKPTGYTSHDLVAQARKRLGMRRIGHSGTLDPDATGVMALALGKATRLIQYLPGDKAYRAVIRLGVETDSYDAAGKVLREAPVPTLTQQDLETLLHDFKGNQMQVPPMVSAISIQGQRLYDLARQGIEIERPARAVCFHAIEVLQWESPLLTLDIVCSAGTYIRSLAHDLGERLGCGGSLASLRRTRAHGFDLAHCQSLEQIEPLTQNPLPGLPADWPLQHLPALTLMDHTVVQRLRQGQPLFTQQLSQNTSQNHPELAESALCRLYTPEQEFAALGQLEQGLIRPRLLLLDPILEKSQPVEG